MATLVDSHVHLDRYTDEEVTAMVSRAAAAGVARLLTIGVDLATSRAALQLAERHPSVLAAVGIHPPRLQADGGPTPTPSPLRWRGEQPAPPPRLPLSRGRERGLGGEGLSPDFLALLDQQPAAIGEVGLDEKAPDL